MADESERRYWVLLAGGAALAAAGAAVWWLRRGVTGRGVKHFPTGEVYEGELVGGRAHGYGVSRNPAGDEVSGFWKDDVPFGRCTARFAAGHSFEGEALDETHWRGTFRYPNKVEVRRGAAGRCVLGLTGEQMDFDGSFDVGGASLSGAVVLRGEDGQETFRGPFVDNVPHGDGCREAGPDGVYEGAMRGGLREGRGRLEGTGGQVYEGEWRAGGREGTGCMRYADGQRYEGTWRAGQWHDGLLCRPDGRVDTVLAGRILK